MNRHEAIYKYVTDLTGGYRDGEEPETGDAIVIEIREAHNKVMDTEGIHTNESGEYPCQIYMRKTLQKGVDVIKEKGDEFDSIMTLIKRAKVKQFSTTNGTLTCFGIKFNDYFDASKGSETLFLIQTTINYNYTE